MGEWRHRSTYSWPRHNKWSASRPCWFTPGKTGPGTHWIGDCAGPRSRSGRRGEEKNLAPAGNQTRAVKPVAIPTTVGVYWPPPPRTSCLFLIFYFLFYMYCHNNIFIFPTSFSRSRYNFVLLFPYQFSTLPFLSYSPPPLGSSWPVVGLISRANPHRSRRGASPPNHSLHGLIKNFCIHRAQHVRKKKRRRTLAPLTEEVSTANMWSPFFCRSELCTEA
jgi:hypothetical protein